MIAAVDRDRIIAALVGELGKRGLMEAPASQRLTFADAQVLAASAEAKARAMGLPVCIAVADAEGGKILFHRMDGSLPASTGLAPAKAWTAAAYRMGTDELGLAAQPGGMLFGAGHTDARVVLFGGGIPCRVDGVVIGAIGISGGTVDEDMLIARHALNEFFQARGTVPGEGTGL